MHRWRRRRADVGTLEDRSPGGVALHRLRPVEVVEVLALVEEWGPTDRSSRKLAHRGSYEGRVWVPPSTVRRTLAAHGLVLPEPPARDPAPRLAWPPWLDWEPNKIWCWDVAHFGAAARAAFAIVDVVSRRWIDTLVSVEETSTQVPILFNSALAAEGLVELITPERVEAFAADATRPILLAASDNGPQMTSRATREFFAARAVAQRLGRPGAPPTKPASRACSDTSRPNGPTSKPSPTPPPSPPNSPASAATTTGPASTPASATSPPTTNMPAAGEFAAAVQTFVVAGPTGQIGEPRCEVFFCVAHEVGLRIEPEQGLQRRQSH